jgi:hypothetical protein
LTLHKFGRPNRTHLGLSGWAQQVDPAAARRPGRRQMLGVGDGVVFGPQPFMVGDQRPVVASHPNPIQVRRNHDPTAIAAGWTE